MRGFIWRQSDISKWRQSHEEMYSLRDFLLSMINNALSTIPKNPQVFFGLP